MKIIKLEEIPEVIIVNPDLNKTGCPVGCRDEGKYLVCYFGLHQYCTKLKDVDLKYTISPPKGI